MTWTLEGRTALITGAASGIGAELARQLTARGMRLGLIDVDGDGLKRVAPGFAARKPRLRTCATRRR